MLLVLSVSSTCCSVNLGPVVGSRIRTSWRPTTKIAAQFSTSFFGCISRIAITNDRRAGDKVGHYEYLL